MDDIVISVRLASYECKSLTHILDSDLVVPRTYSLAALHDCLIQRFNIPLRCAASAATGNELAAQGGSGSSSSLPEQPVISLARGLTTGPALTLKSALKLKWIDMNKENVGM